MRAIKLLSPPSSTPLHSALSEQGKWLPFSAPSLEAEVVKLTSEFKGRLTASGPRNAFLFQASTLGIYSAPDKQDAAAVGGWGWGGVGGLGGAWRLMSVFTAAFVKVSQQAGSKASPQPTSDRRQSALLWNPNELSVRPPPPPSAAAFQKNKQGAFLPLRPRTSTSRSAWGRASSPDAGGLCLHRSCSRVAGDKSEQAAS